MTDQAQPLRDLILKVKPCIGCGNIVQSQGDKLAVCITCQNWLYYLSREPSHEIRLDKKHGDVQ